MSVNPLARVGDPISHNDDHLAVIGGAALGVAVGAFVFFTGGWGGLALGTIARIFTAVSAAGNAGGTGIILGDWLRELGGRSVWGHIRAGAHSVHVGPTVADAARAHPTTTVDCHTSYVAAGSISVFVEGANASRVGDATECRGRVEDGCASVLVGGESVVGEGCRVGDERHGNLYWTAYILASIVAPTAALTGKTMREALVGATTNLTAFRFSVAEIGVALATVAGVPHARIVGAGVSGGSFGYRVWQQRPGPIKPTSGAPAQAWWRETGSRAGGVLGRVVNAGRSLF